ncbi:MAG: PEP-CTERM sorting domain-containing protein [Emcibacter sp.]|nr:PEP-CTERM sorting domain-containing protein [Emcibacter sp.]
MKKILLSAIATFAMLSSANAGVIFLDADSLTTGSDLENNPLLTAEGTITYLGEVRQTSSDPELVAAGSLGNVFDIDNGTDSASFSFDFDVTSFSFIYGGNSGVFDIVARDAFNNIVDSFFQASTSSGEPAGPVTLSGIGIRSIFWQDPGNNFAAIDNVTIRTTSVPEPAPLALLGLGLLGLGLSRKRRA